jgi:hypothetical protein
MNQRRVGSLNWAGIRRLTLAALGGLFLFQELPAPAQTAPSPDVASALAKTPQPPPSNLVIGIDIDRFIGNPFHAPVEVLDGAILVRSILRHGDPYHPGDPGAVLQYRKDLRYGTMVAHNQTPLSAITEQLFVYCEDGKGQLDNGQEFWDLKEGIAALIPPNLKFRVTNAGDEPLHMLILTWAPQPGAKPASTIQVRDVNAMPFTMCGGVICHWSYFGKNVFNSSHGLSPREAIHVVYVPPMSVGEPHAHIPGWEEVWAKLPPYDAYLTLGSEVREMPANTAFLAPPNGNTVHAVQNLRKDATQAWLFIGTFAWDQPDYGKEPLVQPKRLNVP